MNNSTTTPILYKAIGILYPNGACYFETLADGVPYMDARLKLVKWLDLQYPDWEKNEDYDDLFMMREYSYTPVGMIVLVSSLDAQRVRLLRLQEHKAELEREIAHMYKFHPELAAHENGVIVGAIDSDGGE